MKRGEVWWGTAPGGVARRPFLILTRSVAIPMLNELVVAPLTQTIRGLPTELLLDHRDGVPKRSAANFDSVMRIRKAWLTERICVLATPHMRHACHALSIALDC